MSTAKTQPKFTMTDKIERTYRMAEEVKEYYVVELEDGRKVEVRYERYRSEAQWGICDSQVTEDVSLSVTKKKFPVLPEAVEILIKDFIEVGCKKFKRESSPAGSPWVRVQE